MEDNKLLLHSVAKGATDVELEIFTQFCKSKGVNPLDKLILFMKRKDGSVSYLASIDYLRQVAESSGQYDGQDEPLYTESGKYPQIAKVSVYRKGIQRPFVGVARWNEFYPGDGAGGFFWRKMPYHMLAKCAEALSLRKAFPTLLSGLYIAEEMQQERTVFDKPLREPQGKLSHRDNSTNPSAELRVNPTNLLINPSTGLRVNPTNPINPTMEEETTESEPVVDIDEKSNSQISQLSLGDITFDEPKEVNNIIINGVFKKGNDKFRISADKGDYHSNDHAIALLAKSLIGKTALVTVDDNNEIITLNTNNVTKEG